MISRAIVLGLGLVSFFPLVNAAPMCATGTLASYITGGPCMIGDKTFQNFNAMVSGGILNASPATTADITVVPGGSSTNPTFNFNAMYSAGFVQNDSVLIAYQGVAPAGETFTAVGFSLTGASVLAGPAGVGSAVSAESLCLNGSFSPVTSTGTCSGVGMNVGTLANNVGANTQGNLGATLTQNLSNQPVALLGVIQTLNLTGALASSESASAINDTFTATGPTTTGPGGPGSPVPEPSTLLLLGLGLPALAGFRRLRS